MSRPIINGGERFSDNSVPILTARSTQAIPRTRREKAERKLKSKVENASSLGRSHSTTSLETDDSAPGIFSKNIFRRLPTFSDDGHSYVLTCEQSFCALIPLFFLLVSFLRNCELPLFWDAPPITSMILKSTFIPIRSISSTTTFIRVPD